MNANINAISNSLKDLFSQESNLSSKKLSLLRDSVKELHSFKSISQFIFAINSSAALSIYQMLNGIGKQDRTLKKVRNSLLFQPSNEELSYGNSEKENRIEFECSQDALKDILDKLSRFSVFLDRNQNVIETIPGQISTESSNRDISVGELALALFEIHRIIIPEISNNSEQLYKVLDFVKKWRKRTDVLLYGFEEMLRIVELERKQFDARSVEYNLCVSPKKGGYLDSETAASNEKHEIRKRSYIYVEDNFYGARNICLSLDSDFKPLKLDFHPPSHLDSLKSTKSSCRVSEVKFNRNRTQSTSEIIKVDFSKPSQILELNEFEEGTENSFLAQASSPKLSKSSSRSKFSTNSSKSKFNNTDAEIKDFKPDSIDLRLKGDKACMKCVIF